MLRATRHWGNMFASRPVCATCPAFALRCTLRASHCVLAQTTLAVNENGYGVHFESSAEATHTYATCRIEGELIVEWKVCVA
jgi:hypothetical protein